MSLERAAPGWVRLSRTCDNACLFCNDADQLDGAPIDADVIKAAIDAVADAGHTEVVFSGGEPTLSRHLLLALRHARARGLRPALTTHGKLLQTEAVLAKLVEAGLAELRVSVHAGRRRTHDGLVRSDGAWIKALQAIRVAGRLTGAGAGALGAVGGQEGTGVQLAVTCQMVLTPVADGEQDHLMHLVAMSGCTRFVARRALPVGRAPAHAEHLTVTPSRLLEMIAELWYAAKEEILTFDAEGFDDSLSWGIAPKFEPAQADVPALALLRRRVQLHHALQGLTLVDAVGMTKDFSQLCVEGGGLAEVGPELRARAAPLRDGPVCLGGAPAASGQQVTQDPAAYDPVCAACPARPRCPGLAKKLRKTLAGEALAPHPAWAGLAGARVGVVGAGARALVDALRAEGVEAAEGPISDAAAWVALGGAALRALPAAGPRCDLVDDGDRVGAGRADVVWAAQPARVGDWRRAGVPLRRILWHAPAVGAAPRVVPPVPGEGWVGVGDGAARDGVARILGKYGVSVTWHPLEADPWELAAGAAGVVLLPRAETVAQPLAEAEALQWARWAWAAAAAGAPVVAPWVASLEDAVAPEVTGVLVPPGAGAVAWEQAIRRARVQRAALSLAASTRATAATWAGLAASLARGARPDLGSPSDHRPCAPL